MDGFKYLILDRMRKGKSNWISENTSTFKVIQCDTRKNNREKKKEKATTNKTSHMAE